MSDQNDGLNDRLRKARENAKKAAEARKAKDPAPGPKSNFVQYGTMFKLESRPRPRMISDPHPRLLECVNCGLSLEWRIYTVAPGKFDEYCPECKTGARDYWQGKLHKELDDDA